MIGEQRTPLIYCFFSSSKGDSHAWVSAAPGSWEYRGKNFFYMTPMYRNYLFHPNHHVSTILVTQLHAIPLKNTDFLFIIGDGNANVGSQEIPRGIGKFGLGVQNEAEQRLIEFCQENALVIANTLFQQHKRRPYKWTSPDGQHRNQIDYILCSQRWRSST